MNANRRPIPRCTTTGRRRLSTWLATALLLAALTAQAAQDAWVINVKGADIHEFVSQIAEITGKTFIVDPRLKGNVTVVSNTPMDADSVYELFQSVLRVHNFTATPSGNLIRIQATATGKQSPGAEGEPDEISPEELVTQVIAAQNVDSAELVKILRPLIPQYGHIAAVAKPNVVIISDHADNIVRLTEMIEQVDVADENEIVVVPLRDAWVGALVGLLENLAPEELGRNAAGPQRIQLIANERNNSLIVRGKPRPMAEILKLVEKLDQPATAAEIAQVFYLSHAKAADVANILSGLTIGESDTQTGERTSIQADESLNALVVRAPPSAMSEVRTLVEKLDVRRTQVLIEAAIVEVGLRDVESVGVEAAVVDADGQTTPLASTTLDGAVGRLLSDMASGTNTDGAPVRLDVLAGLAGVSQPTLGVARVDLDGVSFGGIITAFASHRDANLLSTPSVMALDNQEATIIVGQQVPFRTGSFTTTGDGSNNPFTTVQRQDVGLTLRVTPHVHEGTAVRMEVDQEITNVIETAVGSASFADVVTSKRQITTTVLADDRQIIVLGGLIQDDVTENRRKVPLLGDIPGLGFLFRSTSYDRRKTNLLVFLRPTVIKTVRDAETSADRKYQDIWGVEITSPARQQIEGLFDGQNPRADAS